MNKRRQMSPMIIAAALGLSLASVQVTAETKTNEQIEEHQETVTMKELKQETADVMNKLKDYSVEQRDDALEAAKSAMETVDKRINALEKSIDENWDDMSDAARTESREKMRMLRQQRVELAEWYGGLKEGSAKAWKEVKEGFGKAYSALQSAWHESDNEFGKAH